MSAKRRALPIVVVLRLTPELAAQVESARRRLETETSVTASRAGMIVALVKRGLEQVRE